MVGLQQVLRPIIPVFVFYTHDIDTSTYVAVNSTHTKRICYVTCWYIHDKYSILIESFKNKYIVLNA